MDSHPMHLPMHNPLNPFDEGLPSTLSAQEIDSLSTTPSANLAVLRTKNWVFTSWKPPGSDCLLHRGSLTLFEDGRMLFWGDVSSEDANDQWRDVFFDFRSGSDALLVRVGSFSYLMEERQCRAEAPCRWMIQTAPNTQLANGFEQIAVVGMKAGGFIGPEDYL
ncbi:hypothetical protein BN8_03506 [Fibrisoma limi BUZ 3]|uniref:Uncharacterized protein n=2 Tax=Fibrisoma limi TaxID=663275 RepID=I2GKB9_9BACT|nr:hypothetical protein BN8_03506 [Fibrisoma limi BUZ 3]